jgi:hypothetical protein
MAAALHMRLSTAKTTVALMLCLSYGTIASAAGWPDSRVLGPFVCRADFPLRELEPFLNELSQLQADLVYALAIPPAKEPIELYLFHDRQTYERYMRQHFPSVPFRRAVYIKANGPGRVFAYRSDQLEIDLRHECTHALLNSSLKNIPLWLDEGLAGYFELPPKQRASGNPHLSSVRWNVWLGMAPKIENLEKCTDITKMGKPEYRDCWAWTCFILHGSPDAHKELVQYLRDIQTQNRPEMLTIRLSQKIPGLQQNFNTFFR